MMHIILYQQVAIIKRFSANGKRGQIWLKSDISGYVNGYMIDYINADTGDINL